MSSTATRRTVVAGLLAAPAAALSLEAIAAPTTSLSAKIAKVRHGMKVARDYEATVCEEARQHYLAAKSAWESACEAVPEKLIHFTTASGEPVTWGTKSRTTIAVARVISTGRHGHAESIRDAAKRFMVAWEGEQAEFERLREVHGLPPAQAEWHRVFDEHSKLDDLWLTDEQAVIDHPCSTGRELAEKLAFVVEQEMENPGLMEALLADAQRLAKREAS